MRALVLENSKLEERDIENNLEAIQGIVGGYIETPCIHRIFMENNIITIINEEGKIQKLPPQLAIYDRRTEKVIDVIVGNIIFISSKGEEFADLSDKQIKIINTLIHSAPIGFYGDELIRFLEI